MKIPVHYFVTYIVDIHRYTYMVSSYISIKDAYPYLSPGNTTIASKTLASTTIGITKTNDNTKRGTKKTREIIGNREEGKKRNIMKKKRKKKRKGERKRDRKRRKVVRARNNRSKNNQVLFCVYLMALTFFGKKM